MVIRIVWPLGRPILDLFKLFHRDESWYEGVSNTIFWSAKWTRWRQVYLIRNCSLTELDIKVLDKSCSGNTWPDLSHRSWGNLARKRTYKLPKHGPLDQWCSIVFLTNSVTTRVGDGHKFWQNIRAISFSFTASQGIPNHLAIQVSFVRRPYSCKATGCNQGRLPQVLLPARLSGNWVWKLGISRGKVAGGVFFLTNRTHGWWCLLLGHSQVWHGTDSPPKKNLDVAKRNLVQLGLWDFRLVQDKLQRNTWQVEMRNLKKKQTTHTVD